MPEKKETNQPKKTTISRKEFIGRAGAAAAGFMFVPRYVLGGTGFKAPSDRLNIACIGVGGMGGSNTEYLSDLGENIYALCDVDKKYAADVLGSYPKAKIYTDFRKMLDQESEIDAVMVATPDNNHAAVAIYAMQLGKHAFVQKPLTRTIYEARRMREVAQETGVKTQMGNQGHAMDSSYKIVEWVQQGLLGEITKVDCWTNRPKGYWPQGANVTYPEAIPAVPGTMSWDLWVGPSPYHPYHPAYAPFVWRGFWDFGSGSLGDMGAHIMDQPYWALKLGAPETVHSSCTPFSDAAFPLASTVHYQFPERDGLPAVELNWYDGGILPPRPEGLEDGAGMGASGGGMLFYGTKATLMADVYGAKPRIIAGDDTPPEKTMERSPGIHEEWVQAIKEDGETSSNFDYAAALTETMLIGNIANRFSSRPQRLEWDAENMRVSNLDEANAWLEERKDFRPGWKEIIG